MKNKYLPFISVSLICSLFVSCLDEHTGDKDKIKLVEMTIYPELGYARGSLIDIWSEALLFSESDNPEKRTLNNIITEDFDFEYERGYEYTFKAEKVWMANPPQDVSYIKYVFVGPLTKKKVIIEDKEEVLEMIVASQTVRYSPSFRTKHDDEGKPEIYDALLLIERDSNFQVILKEIEGFMYESGYEYTVSLKKITRANPYSISYILIDIKDKIKIEKPAI